MSTTPFTDALEQYLRAREKCEEAYQRVSAALRTTEPEDPFDAELVNAEDHAAQELARARDRLEALYVQALHMGRPAL